MTHEALNSIGKRKSYFVFSLAERKTKTDEKPYHAAAGETALQSVTSYVLSIIDVSIARRYERAVKIVCGSWGVGRFEQDPGAPEQAFEWYMR